MLLHELVAAARRELGLGARSLAAAGAGDASRPAAVDLLVPDADAIARRVQQLGGKYRPHADALWNLANGTDAGTVLPVGVTDALRATQLRALAHDALADAFVDGAHIGRRAMSRAPRVTGNTAKILVQDAEYLPRLWQDIRSAERSVTITMYNIEDAGSGERLLQELTALKQRKPGVDIRLVLDAHGTNEPGKARGRALLQRLDDAGIRYVVSSSPLRPRGGGWEHRKIVVIDDRVIYQGGLGFAGTEAGKYGTWMDAMVRMEGPVGAVGAVHSLAMWNDLTRTVDDAARARLAAARDVLHGQRMLAPAPPRDAELGIDPHVASITGDTAHDVPITLLENRPRIDLAITEQFLRDAARVGPGDQFLATSSYLTSPTASRAVEGAARAGADTRVVLSAISGNNDVPFVRIGRTFYRGLLDSGVQLTQWEGRMMHHKSWLMRHGDAVAVNVGSMNLSNMSLRFSRESTARMEGEAIARQYHRFHETLRTTSDPTRFNGGHSRTIGPEEIGTERSDHILGAVRAVVPRAGF